MTRRFKVPGTPRVRVISDNDYSGDPDGLVQLAHHALSTSVDLRAVIGSHLRVGDPWASSDHTADDAAEKARKVLELCGRSDVKVVAGSNVALENRTTPIPSAATEAIIEEAMRDDPRPLYVCLGAGLTELASALLIEPRIADRLTAVWIGGAEYRSIAVAPPGAIPVEYNTAIDPTAAQVVFNDTTVPIWQIPRDAYRQCVASMTEVVTRFDHAGELGVHLADSLLEVLDTVTRFGLNPGETYVMGDSPLVLLTVLQTEFEPDVASSDWRWLPAPVIADDGSYTHAELPRRPIRVFTRLDTDLMMRDLYAKLEAHASQ
ncbi:nucleoside hydrolase [Actinoplanes sp. NPDC051851]|uniref:nucleoside hydrolase n=1 Tax=Actinoplanes sp. NPDC051851 TaxID=3154753 RepID=UPI0034478CCF